MRKPVVGISLKIYMNKLEQTLGFINEIKMLSRDEQDVDLLVFPSMGTLREVGKILEDTSIKYGAQNIAFLSNGALTGEFSIESLIDMNGSIVELGHAERRKYFHETDEMINQKMKLAFENNLVPVLCIGEREEEKERVEEHLKYQIRMALKDISKTKLKELIIAYEPVWAIGKAQAASPEYVHSIHTVIRSILTAEYGSEVAESVRLIYGGSVSQNNTEEIIRNIDVDGVFVGRFGHDPKQFGNIIEQVRTVKR
ncbi:triose-phosphate isomerase [Candidatus Enterococcus murrayae]|uniref:Triosephosphate isomerase n=1 Tax=Candidatus Enterococcus murrayae TaxID=2815321 RepID=A0ABS3HLA3_9ENTE|nr:triose-phosphate isomerase [Enterococcus sp. MJM16]MBO0454225.1 triose-phosphate isomerase [Enterococcus sp. MJM16]